MASPQIIQSVSCLVCSFTSPRLDWPTVGLLAKSWLPYE